MLVVERNVLGTAVVDTTTFTIYTDVVGVTDTRPSIYVTGFDGSVLKFDLRFVESVFSTQNIFVSAPQ